MVTWTITIPDAAAQRVVDAFVTQYNYQEFSDDEEQTPNPESEVDFAKRHVRMFIKDILRAAEANQAAEDARLSAIEDADLVEIT